MTEFPYMLVTTTFKNGELQFPFGVILRDSPLLAQSVNEHEPLLAQDPGAELLIEDELGNSLLICSIRKLMEIIQENWYILDSWEVFDLTVVFKGESKWDWKILLSELTPNRKRLSIYPTFALIPPHLEVEMIDVMYTMYRSGNVLSTRVPSH